MKAVAGDRASPPPAPIFRRCIGSISPRSRLACPSARSPASRPAPPATCTSATPPTRCGSGAWPAPSAAGCCSGWKTTIEAAAGRPTRRALLDDLDWLGLVPDIGATSELRAGPSPLRQSDADATYRTALDGLGAAGRTFVCECSRRDLARAAGDVFNEETRYDGRCRDRGLEPGPGRGVRVRLDPGVERFEDARLGPQAQEPAAQCGDLLAQDRVGGWTYQFAVVVDDLRQGVDLVVRGEDLIESTGRQIALRRLLRRAARRRCSCTIR